MRSFRSGLPDNGLYSIAVFVRLADLLLAPPRCVSHPGRRGKPGMTTTVPVFESKTGAVSKCLEKPLLVAGRLLVKVVGRLDRTAAVC